MLRLCLDLRLQAADTLRRLNESALRSLDEGPAKTLTLHRLGVGPTLWQTLATTNMLRVGLWACSE